MKVLASLGLLAMLAAPARAGGGAVRVQPVKGGGALVALPKTGLGGASFRTGGKSFAEWDFASLPVSPGLRMGFRPQPSLETPAPEAGAAAFHAEAMVETLAAPDLHLAPADSLILDPGPGTPPAGSKPQALAGKSAALKAEIQKVGPIARVNGETAASLGRRVLDLLTGGGSIESAGSILKPAAGLSGGFVGVGAPARLAGSGPAHHSEARTQTIPRPDALSVYARARVERVPLPPPTGLETLVAESRDARQDWSAALRALPSRVTLIAMNAFELGLAFTPQLSKKEPVAPSAGVIAPADAPVSITSFSQTPVVLEPTGDALRDAVASDEAGVDAVAPAPEAEGETFAFFQSAGARELARGSSWRPDYRGVRARRIEPMTPDPAAGLFLASLLPLLGLTLLVGYRLN